MGGTNGRMTAALHHMLTAASATLLLWVAMQYYYGLPCSTVYLLRIVVDLSSGARPDSP